MTVSGKKYRIKSSGRFTLFAAAIIVLLILISNALLGLGSASSMTEQAYIEITVQHGDTLWNIAKTYMPSSIDTRKLVYELCQLNGIAAHELKAGQVLVIPIY
ncbi:MAG: LysM peptidoglycan-binding domain-containing protein [Clostridiales bacterium]|nr:LysM peptidoglycan-binding domain-containing protein [Clostridiales bacterium]